MESESNTALIIGLGCTIMLLLVLLIVVVTSISKRKILEKENKLRILEKEKQIELFRAVAKAEESEKAKIAQNLHDQIIPIVALSARNLNIHISELEEKGIDVSEMRMEVETFADLSKSIRDIAHGLIPLLFTSFGLLKSIEIFVKNFNKGGTSTAEFHNETLFAGELPFSSDDQLIIYRICLEILNNLQKHAKYDYLNVTLEDMKDNFILVFAHDGFGITNEEIAKLAESNKGLGLKSLQSRALFLNAKIDYVVDAGVSFVKLIIPIKK